MNIDQRAVHLASVKGFRRQPNGQWDYLIEPQAGLAYLRVSSFHEQTAQEFDLALDQLCQQGVAGLILDLRFNPGGSLRAAVAMTDRLVDHGLILSTVTRHQAVDRYEAHPQHTTLRVPMAVLVNGSSASASEIVSGALQDHDRAVIVGTRTFGKGVVQNVVDLASRSAAISLTVAHYRLPSGRIIHKTNGNADTDAWGVQPDVVIELSPEQAEAIQKQRSLVDQWVAVSDIPSPAVLIDGQLAKAIQVVQKRIRATR